MYIHVHCRYIIIIIQVHWTFSTVDTVHISSECTLSKDNYCYICVHYIWYQFITQKVTAGGTRPIKFHFPMSGGV